MDPALDLEGFYLFPYEVWQLFAGGRDPISETPIDRFDVDELHEEVRGAPGKVYVACTRGASFFGVEAISGCKMLGKRSIGCLRLKTSKFAWSGFWTIGWCLMDTLISYVWLVKGLKRYSWFMIVIR